MSHLHDTPTDAPVLRLVMLVRSSLVLLAVLILPACASRRVDITSEPAGALVYVNDQEVGITPCSAEFTYYGTYDVRLEKDGYEPLRTKARARAPVYEYPPMDLVAEASPIPVRTVLKWFFTLTPSLEQTESPSDLEAGLVSRAKSLGSEIVP